MDPFHIPVNGQQVNLNWMNLCLFLLRTFRTDHFYFNSEHSRKLEIKLGQPINENIFGWRDHLIHKLLQCICIRNQKSA